MLASTCHNRTASVCTALTTSVWCTPAVVLYPPSHANMMMKQAHTNIHITITKTRNTLRKLESMQYLILSPFLVGLPREFQSYLYCIL